MEHFQTSKNIHLAMETFYDLGYNDLANDFFLYLKKLIQNGHILCIYWINSPNKDVLTEIRDVIHLDKFKNSLKLPFHSV
ncbi:hypothetical protein SAMN05216490_1921 [Mucilaginibacter mallensis]|uniref:Uncharacterized protein n=1 Tax=Mucilaginibacter mallensis TaxID=652787 RepID=A0A1H1VH61_MUCMA|nr:hypothetical protein [Mucilaginibacter mallensis]SDS84082.1 hypothetical protein SAMN05216490_1921 [Mucilaginibacter mallensis]